jgi:hypothetical protein
LKLHGAAVLRFDFTGLGGSEGEFANTTFSSNVVHIGARGTWQTSAQSSVPSKARRRQVAS